MNGWQPIRSAPRDGSHILARASTVPSQPPTTVHWFADGWHLSVNALGEYSDHGCSALDQWVPLPPASLSLSGTGKAVEGWQSMDSAPKDGHAVLLLVPESDGFIWTVEGAFQNGQWNAVHRGNVQPTHWAKKLPRPAASPSTGSQI